jgi:hypothetical protein
MKTSIKFLAAIAIVVSFVTVTGSFAQQATGTEVKEEKKELGYFVLVNTKEEKKVTTVWFFNNDNVLVYEEKVAGVKFNLNKKKTVDMLNQGVEKAVTAWNEKHITMKDKDWMTTLAKR